MRTTLGVILAAGMALSAPMAWAQTVIDTGATGGQEIAVLEGLAPAGEMGTGAKLASPAVGLAPGEYQWWAERSGRRGEVLLTISLAEQAVHVYQGGDLIAVSTISTGRPGYETPRGVYTILQKKKRHFSNLYDNAPMPYMQRLTWDGIALHAGRLPGHPDSHGCIRLPKGFAQALYGVTGYDTVVVVADEMQTAMRTGGNLGLIGDLPPSEIAVVEGFGGFGDLPRGANTDDLNRAMLNRQPTGAR